MPDQQAIPLPSSYAELPLTQIKLSHYPTSSKEVTPIIVLTLYRPGRYNAFTDVMRQEMERAFTLFDLDDRVKCIVVTGDGPKIFCAGADLDGSFDRDYSTRIPDHRDGGGKVSLAIYNCRKPTIAAISGSAVGVGITMTLPMTIRIAPKTAKIGFVFARRGLIMEACSSFFLPRLIGYSRAMHLISTGSTYQADHKLLDGLFSEVLGRNEDVLPRAMELAEEITANCSTVSLALMRDLMWRNPGTAEGTHLLDSKVIFELFSSRDNDEGVKSFLEKRPVNFKGTVPKDAPSSYPWWYPIDVVPRPKAGAMKSKL